MNVYGAFTPMPEGVFPVVLCVEASDITRLLSAASVGAAILYGEDITTLAPLYTALNWIDEPQCITADCEELENEDILADSLGALADGVRVNTILNGEMRALGVALDEAAEVITETLLPLIGITLLGIAAAAVIITVGGIPLAPVAIAAGETVELIIATGALESAVPIALSLAA